MIELHDGIIKNLVLDFERRNLKIVAAAYLSPEDSKRVDIEMVFSEVSNMSSALDLLAIEDNSRSGNINYWNGADGGVCHIFLLNGCIQIYSSNMDMRVLD